MVIHVGKKKVKKEKRRNIQVSTLKKVKDFLKDQCDPMFKSNISKSIGVDYDSLNLVLDMLKIETDQEGRIKLKC